MNHLERLYSQFGQSPWLDNLSRDLIISGTLQTYVDQGIRGVTSNPTILEKAITSSSLYDQQIAELKQQGLDTTAIYWKIVEQDIKDATALLHPLWEASGGRDGFVSLEVSPTLAKDTEATLQEARRLWHEVNSPNLMIKVPATDAGIPVISRLLSEGINVNVTLIFSLDHYRQVVAAYKEGIARLALPPQSVASFFVSRIDSEIDKRLEQIGTEEARNLRGQAAIANAHQAYRIFLDAFANSKDGSIQRLLWASTSAKNPNYEDLIYVRYLLAQQTVNTMPEETIHKVLDHLADDARVISQEDIAHANEVMAHIEAVGVDVADVFQTLENEGVEKFMASFETLLQAIDAK